MKTTVLLDHHLEDRAKYLQAGLREVGWDQLLSIEYVRLRDLGLPNNCPDQDIWRFTQQRHMLLLTSNRNRKGETSLEATIQRENTADSLPVITIAQPDHLAIPDYREHIMYGLIDIIITPENYLGRGRVYIP